MQIVECVQLSPEWWEARRGRVTASNADRVLTPTGKVSAQQRGLIAELIGDMHTLIPNWFNDRPMSPAMRHGRDFEPEARSCYGMTYDREVRMVGGCLTDCGRFWASPDGLIVSDDKFVGVVEIKCVQPKTQAEYLMDGPVLPAEYRPQVHMQLIVTGLPFVDFFSYSPGLNHLLVRVEPDDYTAKLAEELERFWGKLQAAVKLVAPQPEAVA